MTDAASGMAAAPPTSAPPAGPAQTAALSTPSVGWASGPLGRAQAADREIARQTARRARAVAEFAGTRPASADRQQGEPGAMSPERWAARPEVLRDVSEWAAPELVIGLSISAQAAEALLERSLVLVHRLPATLAALEVGELHVGHLWPLLEHVAPIADPQVRGEIEAELLAWMAGRVTTPAQLGARTRRVVLRRNARDASRKLSAALNERGIHLRAERTPGMAAVTAVMTMPEALALYRTLGALVDELEDDPAETGQPQRTRGQKMVDCLLDLVLRPGESDLPPVQVLLTVVASLTTLLGGDEPGEVDGQVVPAELVRDLVRGLEGRIRGATEADADLADAAADAVVDGPVDVGAGVPADDIAGAGDVTVDGRWVLPCDDEDLTGWWDEVERRVLAGELPDEPELLPDEVLRRWAEGFARDVRSDGPGTAPEPPVDPPPGPSTADDAPGRLTSSDASDAWPADQTPARSGAEDARAPSTGDGERGSGPGGSRGPAVEEDPPGGRAGEDPSSRGNGWWATADRAVAHVGAAMFAAQQALGRAGRIVRTAERADATDEQTWRAGPAGRVDAATDALGALAAAAGPARQQLADLLDSTGGGGLADRPRIALVEALSGTFLALSDLPRLRRAGTCGASACRRRPEGCTHDLRGRPGLGPPGPTDGYRPGRELDRWVRARDRRCRFPGCRRRVPKGGELDHHRPHPEGPTSAGNLAGYCTGNHRGKHQAPGWRHELAPDGTLTVTTPSALTATTTPPPY